MKIKCIENRISILPEKLINFYDGSTAPLNIGKSYTVYTIQENYGITWFCILSENSTTPWWHPEFFFEISDRRLSRYWIFNFWKDEQNIQHEIIGFPEWANNIYFYTDLVESDDESWKIFNAYKKIMDMEFPDLKVVKTAEIGDDNWLICPLCIDAFESNTQDALVMCPKCKNIFNNPRYKNELPTYKLQIK